MSYGRKTYDDEPTRLQRRCGRAGLIPAEALYLIFG